MKQNMYETKQHDTYELKEVYFCLTRMWIPNADALKNATASFIHSLIELKINAFHLYRIETQKIPMDTARAKPQQLRYISTLSCPISS